ncbi:MAG TPA: serine/threonine-protein kinase [Gemmatimonadales bacterium]|nr:serine/threonine-protein kinase [Gemmatimonadales bacterium]
MDRVRWCAAATESGGGPAATRAGYWAGRLPRSPPAVALLHPPAPQETGQLTEEDFTDLAAALEGRYQLERPLGRGGMGVVYLARDLRLERLVAIKLLPRDRAAQADARDRFLREARTAARLSHPHIVPIFSVHEVGEFVFFAMAYVPGETLGQRIRSGGPLGPRAAARILREVASALAHAHQQGIIHRDVKPDNILLEGTSGRAMVTDFGIAHAEHAGNSRPRVVLGTAEFMSPEQACGAPLDPRSDLYALGVVGFYALSGHLPFHGPDAYAVMARHVADPPPPLATLAPGVPHRLAEVIHHCLAKEPAHRPSSGYDLAAAVARAVGEVETAPLAVRAFLTESRQLASAALGYALIGGVAAIGLAGAAFLYPLPREARVAALAMTAALALAPLALSVWRARRLIRAGHVHRDLTDALHEELVRRREELAFLYGDGPTPLERVFGAAAWTTLTAAIGILAAIDALPQVAEIPGVFGTLAATAATSFFAALLARSRTEHRTDPRAERRLRFWRGPVGRLIFRLAGVGIRPPGERAGLPPAAVGDPSPT